MGRKLNGCRNGRQVHVRRAGRGRGRRVRKVPVPGALAAPQDAPQLRQRITGRCGRPISGERR